MREKKEGSVSKCYKIENKDRTRWSIVHRKKNKRKLTSSTTQEPGEPILDIHCVLILSRVITLIRDKKGKKTPSLYGKQTLYYGKQK